jgi:RHS repeat-associated protein
MEMTDTDNTILKTYIYANGQPLCQHDGDYSAAKYFYIHDRLGSTRQIIDTSASVVRYYTYEPFGEVLEEDGTLTNYMMFTGQYFDMEIDQYYLRARQYDPHISRFTVRDPVFGQYKEPLTLHRYLYCLNAPINHIDPGGLETWHIMGSGMFSVGFSLMYQTGIVWDDKGNWGFITTSNSPHPIEGFGGARWGVGWGIPAVSLGVAVGWTSADTIFDLEGPGISVGASVGTPLWGPSLGVDYIQGIQRDSEYYYGFEVIPGYSAGSFGWEAHGHYTWTTVDEWNPTSRRDTINEYIDELFENSLYEVQTVGQGYFLLMFWGELP